MNYAAAIAANQKFNLGLAAAPYGQSAERVLRFLLDRFPNSGFGAEGSTALLDYMQKGISWNGSTAQLNTKVAGAARLIVGAGEYQFN
jgi:hypothetical protein